MEQQKIEFTKGPWFSKGIYVHSQGKISDIGQAFVKVEWEHGKVKEDVEAIANAKLIAQAPTMLEALQDALCELNQHTLLADDGIIERIKSVLLKATT